MALKNKLYTITLCTEDKMIYLQPTTFCVIVSCILLIQTLPGKMQLV